MIKKQRLQENVLMLLRLINNNFSYRLIEFYDIKDKIEILEKNIDLIKLIVGENLYCFNILCKNFAFDIAKYYGQIQDKENTVYWLNESFNYAQALNNVANDGVYDSYWIKGVNYSISKN